MTTDYCSDTGDPSGALRAIGEAGFTHVHWCHHWNTDFLYHSAEVRQIRLWLRNVNLDVLDIHASAGREKTWGAAEEYRRAAGVGLVANRIEMAAELEAQVVILHAPTTDSYDSQRRSMDQLEPVCRRHGVRIAIENLPGEGWNRIDALLAGYSPQVLGLCYDSGHGNLEVGALDQLHHRRTRLLSLHLHDNDGTGDQHRLPFTGTVPWSRLADEIARSAYEKCVSLEVSLAAHRDSGETAFLAQARRAATRLSEMIRQERTRSPAPPSQDSRA
jgi:sugar phosphate isomerase/epimerase